jgi:hypothetical protein
LDRLLVIQGRAFYFGANGHEMEGMDRAYNKPVAFVLQVDRYRHAGEMGAVGL